MGEISCSEKINIKEIVKSVLVDVGYNPSAFKISVCVYKQSTDLSKAVDATLDCKDVATVLKSSGVEDIDTEKVKIAYETVIDDKSYELKASNIVPKCTSKSIKINTKVANISVSPRDLSYVRQVMIDGNLCLVIEVEENTVIEGFEMIPKHYLKK